MNAHLLERMQMEHALRQALENQHMSVHYQPQVDMASGRIIWGRSTAALDRPRTGHDWPRRFHSAGRGNGLHRHPGCVGAGTGRAGGGALEAGGTPIVVSVNVSALEMRQPDFIERLNGFCARTIFRPNCWSWS